MKTVYAKAAISLKNRLTETEQPPQFTVQKRQTEDPILVGIISKTPLPKGTYFPLEESLLEPLIPIGQGEDPQKPHPEVIHGNKENIGIGRKQTVVHLLGIPKLLHHIQRHIIAVSQHDCSLPERIRKTLSNLTSMLIRSAAIPGRDSMPARRHMTAVSATLWFRSTWF